MRVQSHNITVWFTLFDMGKGWTLQRQLNMKFYWASGLLFSWNFPNRKFTLSTPNFNFTTSSFLIKKFPAHTSQAPTSFIHIKVKSSRYTKHNIRSHSHSDVHVLLMEGIESTLCLKHKSVYWFNDQVSRFLTSSRYRLSKTALFTRFKPFAFLQLQTFFSTFTAFVLSANISRSKSLKASTRANYVLTTK